MARRKGITFPELSVKLLREIGVCEGGVRDFRAIAKGRARFRPTREDLRFALENNFYVVGLIERLCRRDLLPWSAHTACLLFARRRLDPRREWNAKAQRLRQAYITVVGEMRDALDEGRDAAMYPWSPAPDFAGPLRVMREQEAVIERRAKRLQASYERHVTREQNRAIDELADALGLE